MTDVDVTPLLQAWGQGDRRALDQLMPLVYDQLRRLAHDRLQGEYRDRMASTTELVHEAYLRLVDISRVTFRDRSHFMAMASRAMRRVLVEHARRRQAQKRGGGNASASFEEALFVPIPDGHEDSVIELDRALVELEEHDARQCEIVEHRYFSGLTLEATAEVLCVSVGTVKRDLRFAKAWLATRLRGGRAGDADAD